MRYDIAAGVALGIIIAVTIIAISLFIFDFILYKTNKKNKTKDDLKKRAYEAIIESNRLLDDEEYYKNRPAAGAAGIEIKIDKSKLTKAELKLMDNGYAPAPDWDPYCDYEDGARINDYANNRLTYIRYYKKTDTGDCFLIDDNHYNLLKEIIFDEFGKSVCAPRCIDASITSAIVERFSELGWA